MKKVLIVMLLLLTAGCGKNSKSESKKLQDKLLGTWETKYELSVFGEVTESYVFKENGECVRMLNTGSDIANKCTYEFDESRDNIKIVWEDKLDKERYDKFIEIDDNNIMIAEHKFTRKKN